MLIRPKWSIASEVRRFAVMISPFSGPAPTLLNEGEPGKNCNCAGEPGQRRPPRHRADPFERRQWTRKNGEQTGEEECVKCEEDGQREPRVREKIRSCALITAPNACIAPATRMKGKNQIAFMRTTPFCPCHRETVGAQWEVRPDIFT